MRQNLLYQKAQLSKEIATANRTTVETMPSSLIDEADFRATGRGDGLEEHQYRIARLTWELEERKRLVHELEQMETEKSQVSSHIASTRQFLNTLQEKLAAVSKACLPFQAEFGKVKEMATTPQEAYKLAPPLFVLFQSILVAKQRQSTLVMSLLTL